MTTKTSKKTITKSEPKKEEVAIKRVDSYQVTFTIEELVHLRDLFNVLLPPTAEQTVSQALAAGESRPMTEAKLWAKIAKLCNDAKIPMEDAAPDYVISLAGPPTLGVFPMNTTVQQAPDDNSSEEG